MNILLQSFQDYSIIWIIVSAGVGGLLGALIKFIFEQILATRYQYEFDAKKVLRKYKDPILRSADSLDRRLENFIRFANKSWYDDPPMIKEISSLLALGEQQRPKLDIAPVSEIAAVYEPKSWLATKSWKAEEPWDNYGIVISDFIGHWMVNSGARTINRIATLNSVPVINSIVMALPLRLSRPSRSTHRMANSGL